MRKTLKFNDQITGQDTGWNCGPATLQNIVWASTGKVVPEGTFAKQMGTTVNGTNHIGLLTNALNAHLPAGKFKSVQLPNDPPTRAQKDALWSHIVQSINAGFGVAMNWVAPPSNYPRGILGSASPSYGGGTVYHYVMAAGYDDVAKAVLIVDSGFWPRVYWVSFDQCASLIPPKGYSYSSAGTAVKPLDPPKPTPSQGALGPVKGEAVQRMGARLWNDAAPTRQVIVVHDTEGGYEGAIGWMEQKRNGSYHTICSLDGRETWMVAENRQAWGAMPAGNRIGLHTCIEGYAKWSRQEWISKGGGGLERMARRVADWSKRFNIPLVRLTPAEVRAGKRGVCTHDDISKAFRESDHTDPGVGFPLDLVLARARAINGEDFLMALSDAEQRELLAGVRYIKDQLGPNIWGADSSVGKDAKGGELTLRDGLAKHIREAA